MVDEHESAAERIEQEIVRIYEREKFIWSITKPILMSGLALLITLVEPFTAWFIVIDAFVWLAAVVDWYQFAMDRLRPEWRNRNA